MDRESILDAQGKENQDLVNRMRAYKDPLLEEFDKEQDEDTAASKGKGSDKKQKIIDSDDDDDDSDGSEDSDEDGSGEDEQEDIKFPRDNAEDLLRFI